jgi:hypothetical protein
VRGTALYSFRMASDSSKPVWIIATVLALGAAFVALRKDQPLVPPSPAQTTSPLPAVAATVPATVRDKPQGDLATQEDVPQRVESDSYVSASQCVECHPVNHSTWKDSYHSKMTQLATPEAVLGDFDNLEASMEGYKFRLWREKDEFWAEIPNFPALGGDPDQPTAKLQVVLTTGSHHNQMYWLATGKSRTLCLLPIAHRVQENRWVPFKSLFLSAPRSGFEHQIGRWNNRCTQCHTTNGKPNKLAEHTYDTTVGDFGISCEACHGPAKEHVVDQRRRKVEGLPPGRSDDDQVVNPADLTHVRGSEVCARCHSYNLPVELDIPATDFRPGDEFAKTHHYWRNTEESKAHMRRVAPESADSDERVEVILNDMFWPDGESRTAGREFNGLAESACFTKGTMSCMSCHQLHQRSTDEDPKDWANDQLREGLRNSNRSCLKCHDREKFESSDHTHHAPDSSGSVCYNCHMPHTTYGLFSAIRSHKISLPSVKVNLETKRPNACNLCHLDQSLEWTATHLKKWYDQPIPEMDSDHRKIASGALWSLQGDALQRALTAWSMGWAPAQKASNPTWMAPYLAELMKDPYDAIRHISRKSLHTLSGFEAFQTDFLGPPELHRRDAERVLQTWLSQPKTFSGNDRRLLDPQSKPIRSEFNRLLGARDHTFFNLPE